MYHERSLVGEQYSGTYVKSCTDWTLWKVVHGLRRQQSHLVNGNSIPRFQLSVWLVDDSAAVSLRYVLTRDWMTIFLCFSVCSFCGSSCCLPCHLMVDTCALMDIRTSTLDTLQLTSHMLTRILTLVVFLLV